jgi:hypothetical protein
MRKSLQQWSWTLAVVLLAPWLLGTTYKWVDSQGQVHFTDTPPPQGTAYEVIAAPHAPPVSAPPAAMPAPAAAVAQPVPVTAAAAPSAIAPDAAGASGDDARCVDALFQLQVLAGDWKVYRPGPGNDRTYLHDRDRPAEIERLSRERDASCSEDPAVLASQERRANELFQALSPACREAREKLQNMQRPTARSAPSDIEKQQAWIAARCPDVSRDGVWLADWVYVRTP